MNVPAAPRLSGLRYCSVSGSNSASGSNAACPRLRLPVTTDARRRLASRAGWCHETRLPLHLRGTDRRRLTAARAAAGRAAAGTQRVRCGTRPVGTLMDHVADDWLSMTRPAWSRTARLAPCTTTSREQQHDTRVCNTKQTLWSSSGVWKVRQQSRRAAKAAAAAAEPDSAA